MGSEHNHSLEEYKEANSNMRHFSNQRIGALTLSLALNGVLIDGTINQENIYIACAMGLLGMLSVAYFLLFDTRVAELYYTYRDRARALERDLNFKLYKEKGNSRKRFGVTKATKIFYSTIAILWATILLSKLLG